ncbi:MULTISPECIES: hypothetical protein [unclassified Streptomyces]|uniref:hypothetical protein n=1 Tax=unclassified Streptomyces TaxID=2593676 RepID=UPI002E0FF47C|nr:hypothetical protein OG452_23980 [Streptomyces sp. NBC_01197]WSS49163.1 hypothetical protein OG708_11250 [Streptomyces sp. NBC_01180]
MEAVILILVLLFLVFLGVGAYAAVKVVGAARRSVDRTISQARRSVEDTALRAKSYGQPGAAGELAQLRLSLRTSMRATQDALHAGVAEDESLRETLGLFERLSAHGLELDAELRRLEREPDKTGLGQRLPALRERTEQITHSADALRWAARDRARKFADDDLIALNEQIDVEAGALRHWTTPAADGHPQGRSQRRSEAAGSGSSADEGAGDADGSDAGPRAGSQAGPDAITGRDPNRQQRYPWQKAARPESTT